MSDQFCTHIFWENLVEDQPISVETPWGTAVLMRSVDKLVAFSPRCPHASANLLEGHWGNGRITCPKHGWKFNLVSGRTIYPADEACRLKRYPAEINDGQIWLG